MKIVCSHLKNSEPIQIFRDCEYIEDTAAIGCEQMVLRYAQQNPDQDIFILHNDITENDLNWREEVLKYKQEFPKAGVLSCTLIFPETEKVQFAGGKFNKGIPEHNLEPCDKPRKSDWATFAGCLLTAEALAAVPYANARMLWSYIIDCDWSLQIKRAGFDIIQIPTKMYHVESRDNKIFKSQNPTKAFAETHNLRILKEEWNLE